MGRRIFSLILLLPVIGGLIACERSKSSNPLSPSIAGPIAGVTVDAPKAVEPAPASQIAVHQQPITLVIENATTNSPRPFTYIFEISTDATFTTKVFTQTGVEPGAGRTSVKLPQSLTPERKYYWRVKADDGANASEFTAPVEFVVYTPVVIDAPWLSAPTHGASGVPRKPTLVVNNSKRSGPAGAIQYLFELATDGAFSNKVASKLVGEGSSQTSFAVTDDLAFSTTYYWRVKAMDPGHESVYSGIGTFTTLAAPIIVNPGPITGPNPNAIDDLNMGAATIWNSPSDLASWPATSKITGLDMRSYGIRVDFHKKDGPGRWPDVYPPGWDEPLQYTLGLCFNISGKWHCSASIQFWNGLGHSGGPPSRYSAEWFYDAYRWGPLASHQPAVGEKIGVFVCAGDCRNTNSGHKSTVKERTNVVIVPMPSDGGASHSF